MRITLIDYGAGNLPSVERAFQHLGVATERATTPEQIASAQCLVLPGAGIFRSMMRRLDTQQLAASLREALQRQVPLLGISLGMHALYERSADAPGFSGFSVFPGEAAPLPRSVKLPHIGWNQIRPVGNSHLLRGIPQSAWFYFAHTLAIPAGDASISPGRVLEMRPSAVRLPKKKDELPAGTIATCSYGHTFVAAAEKGRMFAVQFQPEKSGPAGMDVLRNFLEAVR